MNEKNATSTFTSPLTGTTYSVVTTQHQRGAWDVDGNYAPVTVTEYEIFDGNRKVQFAFDEAGIARSVAHYEGVSDGWTSSPRD